MLKATDVARNRVTESHRYVIVPQKRAGEATDRLQAVAPKTWAYLNRHAAELANRKSSIYRNNPPFSIFGVGDYAFLPWKIATSALHKRLRFRMIVPIGGKPVMLDDTTYFVGFASADEAAIAYERLTSPDVLACLQSLIFWDEKRPVKASVLNSVDWSRSSTVANG
jgi:hypothetical protein